MDGWVSLQTLRSFGRDKALELAPFIDAVPESDLLKVKNDVRAVLAAALSSTFAATTETVSTTLPAQVTFTLTLAKLCDSDQVSLAVNAASVDR